MRLHNKDQYGRFLLILLFCCFSSLCSLIGFAQAVDKKQEKQDQVAVPAAMAKELQAARDDAKVKALAAKAADAEYIAAQNGYFALYYRIMNDLGYLRSEGALQWDEKGNLFYVKNPSQSTPSEDTKNAVGKK